MKYEFSKREKIMLVALILLVVGLVYYKFMLTPINDKISVCQSDTAKEQSLIDTSAPQMAKMAKMQKELETLKSVGEAKAIPEYDNSKKVMDELHLVMSGVKSYTLNFNGTAEKDGIVRRQIYMTFVTAQYQQARAIIDKLHNSDYMNQISDLSFSTSEEDGVQVDLTITFYELDSNYSAAAATDAAGVNGTAANN